MKKILFSALIMLLINSSFAQKRIDYKDVYNTVLTENKEKGYTLLVAYQKQDPEFANTYFQLGLIAHEWALKFNPFTEFAMMKLFIYNTKLYYNLAKVKLDDEKKKNKEYYLNVKIVEDEKKLTIDDIKAYIEKKTNEIETYENNIIQIITYYNKSSDSYNECVNTFMAVNKQYNKIKSIYLSEDEAFNQNLEKLVTEFDSTLYYFNLYKSALNQFPLFGYNQNYTLKDIYTFRLDGLSYSNFMENDIVLWNYKKWVNDVRDVKNKNISTNRSDITEADRSMKALMKNIESGDYIQEYKPFIPDKKLIYKIEKFDNNSLVVKLIRFNSSKINFLKYFMKSVNDPGIDSLYTFHQYLKFTNEIVEFKKTCDSLKSDLINYITDVEINKYPEFYNSQYNGIEGLKIYIEEQDLFFQNKLNVILDRLKYKLRKEFIIKDSGKITYKNITIEKKQYFPNKGVSEIDKYYFWDFKKSKKGVYTIKGFYKTKQGYLAGFSGLSSDLKTFNTFVKSEPGDSSDVLFSVTEPNEQGFFAIETSTGKKIVNKLIQINKSGKKTVLRNLPIEKIPRFMTFDEINNSLMIVFNGENMDVTNENSPNEQVICLISLEEEESKFIVRNPIKGYVFDIIKTDNKYIVFSNYSYFENEDGTKNWSDAGNSAVSTNISATVISEEGKIINQIPIKNKEPITGIKAIKINSNLFNILGLYSDFKNEKFDINNNSKLFYLRIDSEIRPIYTGWHD